MSRPTSTGDVVATLVRKAAHASMVDSVVPIVFADLVAG